MLISVLPAGAENAMATGDRFLPAAQRGDYHCRPLFWVFLSCVLLLRMMSLCGGVHRRRVALKFFLRNEECTRELKYCTLAKSEYVIQVCNNNNKNKHAYAGQTE
jgi:hypothetical protein